MKRHEACHYINVIRNQLTEQLQSAKESLKKPMRIWDAGSNAMREATPQEAVGLEKHAKGYLILLDAQITALDMAGDALTS